MSSSSSRRVIVIDETYVDAAPGVLAGVFTHPANVATVWPHVTARLVQDRGDAGATWAVEGHLSGEFEVWIEPYWEGAIVHHYVRAVAARGRPGAWERAHVRRWKRFVTAVKDKVEPSRRVWTFRGGESSRSAAVEG